MTSEEIKSVLSQLEALMSEETAGAHRPDGASVPRHYQPLLGDPRRRLYTENPTLDYGQSTEESAGARAQHRRQEVQPVSTPRPPHLYRGEMSHLPAEPVVSRGQNTAAAMSGEYNELATSPQQQQRQSMIKLQRYNGEEPADTYLLQVQLAAQINGWSAEETAGHVALSLEGRALKILTDLRPAELRDWPKLKRAIQRRFDRHLLVVDARDRLAKRRRELGESLGTYAADLRSYTRRGHPDFSERVQEELTVQAFLRGLQPERLREHLRLFSPATLEAALTEAERVEHVLCPEGNRRSYIRVNQAGSEDADDMDEEARRTTVTPQQRRSRRNYGDCYRCGAPGHIARYCPAPTPRSQQPDLN